jgi:hypothetical protein
VDEVVAIFMLGTPNHSSLQKESYEPIMGEWWNEFVTSKGLFAFWLIFWEIADHVADEKYTRTNCQKL